MRTAYSLSRQRSVREGGAHRNHFPLEIYKSYWLVGKRKTPPMVQPHVRRPHPCTRAFPQAPRNNPQETSWVAKDTEKRDVKGEASWGEERGPVRPGWRNDRVRDECDLNTLCARMKMSY